MNKERLQKLAGIITEAEQPTATGVRQSSVVTAIQKDLQDQTANFELIRDSKKVQELFNIVVSKLDPKFLESSQFKTFIRNFYNTYK